MSSQEGSGLSMLLVVSKSNLKDWEERGYVFIPDEGSDASQGFRRGIMVKPVPRGVVRKVCWAFTQAFRKVFTGSRRHGR